MLSSSGARRLPWLIGAVSLGVIILVGVVIVVLSGRGGDSSVASEPTVMETRSSEKPLPRRPPRAQAPTITKTARCGGQPSESGERRRRRNLLGTRARADRRAFGLGLLAYDTATLIGLRRRGHVWLNSRPDSRIENGDELILVAEDDSTIQLKPSPASPSAPPARSAARSDPSGSYGVRLNPED